MDEDVEDIETDEPGGTDTLILQLEPGEERDRLDKALAGRWPDLSRARLQALIGQGALSRDGVAVTEVSGKAAPGRYALVLPPARAAEPEPEDIPLTVLFEDAHLIVIDKPAGMAAHPAPGSWAHTLVNALLFHCAGSLSGIGGVARPGIVHRLDKDTSGVMVAAKTDQAHGALSAMFAAHDMERRYVALARGAPYPRRGTIETQIGRSAGDRKKMAVLKTGGRTAITHYAVEKPYGPLERPSASRVSCQLETGRTHQIRVHLASKGHPILGDATYGSGVPAGPVRDAIAQAGLQRQALHAAVLGFRHPVTGEALRFETPPPADMAALERLLAKLA